MGSDEFLKKWRARRGPGSDLRALAASSPDFSEGLTGAAREIVVLTLIEHGDRMDYDELLEQASATMARMFNASHQNPISQDSARIDVSNAISMLTEAFRIDRDIEQNMVFLLSDLQMLAEQIYQMIYWSKDPLTLEQVVAKMKDGVRAGRTPQAYDDQQIDGVINSALNYLIDDERRVKVTEHGFVAVDAPKITVDEAQRGEFQPKPGSAPVEHVLQSTPFVDAEKEKDKLLDQFNQGLVTREVLDQKLRRLRASFRDRWLRRAAAEQKLIRELVCTVIGSDSGTTNEAVLPAGTVVGVQRWSNDHTIFFYSPIYSRMIVRGKVMIGNQYSASVQDFRAATDVGYGEGTGYEHGPECFCDECVAKDDMGTHRCPSCGSRECPGDGDTIDCRKPGTMRVEDVPVESRDSLLDRFNKGEIDEETLRRRMKQISIKGRWMARRADFPKEWPDAITAFMQAYWDQTVAEGLRRNHRIYNDETILEVSPWHKGSVDDSSPYNEEKGVITINSDPEAWVIRLNWIQALEPGQGQATRAMQWLTALADEYGVFIELEAKPTGTPKIPKKKLMDFYKDKGFEKSKEKYTHPGDMVRNPAIGALRARWQQRRAADLPEGFEYYEDETGGHISRPKSKWRHREFTLIRPVDAVAQPVKTGEQPVPIVLEPGDKLRVLGKAAETDPMDVGHWEVNERITSREELVLGWLDGNAEKLYVGDPPRFRGVFTARAGDFFAAVAEIDGLPPGLASVRSRWMRRRAEADDLDFESWFSGSKVINSEGQPLIVFHGSTHPWIASFDKGYQGKGVVNPSQRGQGGFFFSNDRGAASYFSDRKPKKMADVENVSVYGNAGKLYYSVVSRSRNPEDAESIFQGGPYTTDKEALSAGRAEAEAYNKSLRQDTFTQGYYLALRNPMESRFEKGPTEAISEAKSKGHDGVIARDVFDGDTRSDVYIAFEPEQIKSVRVRTGDSRSRWLRSAAQNFTGYVGKWFKLVDELRVWARAAADQSEEVPSIVLPKGQKFKIAQAPFQLGHGGKPWVMRISWPTEPVRGVDPGDGEGVVRYDDFHYVAIALDESDDYHDLVIKSIEWKNADKTLGYARWGTKRVSGGAAFIIGADGSVAFLKSLDDPESVIEDFRPEELRGPLTEAIQAETLPKGERPGQMRTTDVPSVDPVAEENRVLDEFNQGKITREDLDRKLRRFRASFRLRWQRRAADTPVPSPATNPDHDLALYDYQDSTIEPIPKMIWDKFEQANYLGIALEGAGDIFRELVGFHFDEGYIGEKTRRIRGYWDRLFRPIEPEAEALCEQLVTLWSGIDLSGKSPRLLACRDLNVALARHDQAAAQAALSAVEGGKKASFQSEWSRRRASASKRKKAKKGTETFCDLEIAIEFEPGDQKTCDNGDVVDYDDFYGEVVGTQALADGDPVDVYLSEDAHGNDDRPVFIIHQLKKDKSYDEDKVFLGFPDEAAATKCYETSGPPWGFGSLETMTWDQFLNGYLKGARSPKDMGAKSVPKLEGAHKATILPPMIKTASSGVVKFASGLGRDLDRLAAEIACQTKSAHGLPGKLVVFEGLDGAGKSTQLAMARDWLVAQGHEVVVSVWNSSDLVAETTKRAKKAKALVPVTFSLLHATDLAERLNKEIIPALRRGAVVLCDRYLHTGLARDAVRGMDSRWLRRLYSFALVPDLALYFDIPVDVAVGRCLTRNAMAAEAKAVLTSEEPSECSALPSPKFYEAGIDLGLAKDAVENFHMFQTAVVAEYRKLVPEFSMTVVDAQTAVNGQHAQVQAAIGSVLPISGMERQAAGDQDSDEPTSSEPKQVLAWVSQNGIFYDTNGMIHAEWLDAWAIADSIDDAIAMGWSRVHPNESGDEVSVEVGDANPEVLATLESILFAGPRRVMAFGSDVVQGADDDGDEDRDWIVRARISLDELDRTGEPFSEVARRVLSRQSSFRDRWLRRAAREETEPDGPQEQAPEDDDIVIQDRRGGGYSAFQSGREIAHEVEYNMMLWRIRQHMDKQKFWPGVWVAEERGGYHSVDAHGAKPPVPPPYGEVARAVATDIIENSDAATLQKFMDAYHSVPPGSTGLIKKLISLARVIGSAVGDAPEYADSAFWEGVGIQVVRHLEDQEKEKIKNQTPSKPVEVSPEQVPGMTEPQRRERIDALLDQLQQTDKEKEKRQIEQRIRSLQASSRTRWMQRRAASPFSTLKDVQTMKQMEQAGWTLFIIGDAYFLAEPGQQPREVSVKEMKAAMQRFLSTPSGPAGDDYARGYALGKVYTDGWGMDDIFNLDPMETLEMVGDMLVPAQGGEAGATLRMAEGDNGVEEQWLKPHPAGPAYAQAKDKKSFERGWAAGWSAGDTKEDKAYRKFQKQPKTKARKPAPASEPKANPEDPFCKSFNPTKEYVDVDEGVSDGEPGYSKPVAYCICGHAPSSHEGWTPEWKPGMPLKGCQSCGTIGDEEGDDDMTEASFRTRWMQRRAHCGVCHEIQFAALHTLADIAAEHPDLIEKELLEELARMTSEMRIGDFARKLALAADFLSNKEGLEDKSKELRNKATTLFSIEDDIEAGRIEVIDKPREGSFRSKWFKLAKEVA